MAGLLDYLTSPERTQQVQGLGGLLKSGYENMRGQAKRYEDLRSRAFGDARDPLRVTDRGAFSELTQMTMAGPLGFMPAGIFVGAGSKSWDAVSNKVAKELDAAGVDAREIWSRTGNWKAPDGKWRQEISDRGAELRTTFDASMASKANNYVGGLEGPIGGMLRHEELYKAYPELLRTDRMSVTKLPEWLPESANSGVYKRTYGGKGDLEIRNKTEEGALNTAVHELQHGVQNIEKFQGGGMEGQFKDIPGGKSAFEQYRALQGEAEARAAAARQMLTNEQRRALFPEDSYDMPISGLLSR